MVSSCTKWWREFQSRTGYSDVIARLDRAIQ